MKLSILAFDADDTLWHNEHFYDQSRSRLCDVLAAYASPEITGRTLDEIETHNVRWYGYGIKSFTLSMVETAVALSNGRVQGSEISAILDLGREMLSASVQLFDGVEGVLTELGRHYPLMLITKGDLLEQENKVQRSGLAAYFRHIEIVREKTPASYQALLDRYGISAPGFLMVGNSLRSDILPVLACGGLAVHIPYATTWIHEYVPPDQLLDIHYHELPSLADLPGLIAQLEMKQEGF